MINITDRFVSSIYYNMVHAKIVIRITCFLKKFFLLIEFITMAKNQFRVNFVQFLSILSCSLWLESKTMARYLQAWILQKKQYDTTGFLKVTKQNLNPIFTAVISIQFWKRCINHIWLCIAPPVYYQISAEAGFAAPGLPGPPTESVGSASFDLQPQPESLIIRKEFPETWILDMLNFADDERFVEWHVHLVDCVIFFLVCVLYF